MIAFVTGGSGFLGRNLIEALVARGDTVRALARSERAAAMVRHLGAEPVDGDLDAVDGMKAAMAGCDIVFHVAAHVKLWDPPEVFHRINVQGTKNVLAAARAAGVPRFVHVSTEAVLVDGSSMAGLDESRPLPLRPIGLYSITKGLAEQAVLAANGDGFTAVAVRPPLIWGKGDTSVLPQMIDAVKTGKLMWIGGGRYPHTTTHVRNVVEGLLLAAEKGRGGEAYFVTDGPPREFRWFITELLKTQGITVPDRSMPFAVAKAIAVTIDAIWSALGIRAEPPFSRAVLYVMGWEVSVDDSKARRELGYEGRVSIEHGLAEMAGS